MPDVIANFDSRAAKFFTAFSFMLATIGNQVAAGSYPFSNDVTGIAPKYVNIFRGTIFICLFCVVSTPWNIIKNAAGLLAFLSGYSCLMGPLSGIIVCDYYIIKQRKLNLHEMYQDHGIYWYTGGWNWRAFAAFITAVAPLMPGFAKSIAPTLNVGGSWKLYAFAWIFGFTYVFPSFYACGHANKNGSIAFTVYYVINKYISPQTVSLVDVAVYPRQLGDPETPTSLDGEEVEDLKAPATTTEKEMV
jgi:NCS1 family nucleobase:cation symporter-1